ncbi:VP2 [Pata virus]|nr:VP2 [Pata virus]
MNELGICVYRSGEQIPSNLITRYPVLIDLSNRIREVEGKHDVTQLAGKHNVDVQNVPARFIRTSTLGCDTCLVFPSLLETAIISYDMRKGGQRATREWLERNLRLQTDYQPIRADYRGESDKITYQMCNSRVSLISNYAETAAFDYRIVPVNQNCKHANADILDELIFTDYYKVSQGESYMLKDTVKLVHSATTGTMNSSPLTRQQPMGERRRIAAHAAFSTVNEFTDENAEQFDAFLKNQIQVVVRKREPNVVSPFLTRLERLVDGWLKAVDHKANVDVGAVCQIVSNVGRLIWNGEYEYDDRAVSNRFQENLNRMLDKDQSTETANILASGILQRPMHKFLALLAITATDTYGGRLWWDNPYPCFRGCIMITDLMFTDTYKVLRDIYSWSLRPNQATQREIQKERNTYPFRKVNLFEDNGRRNNVRYSWEQEPLADELEVCLDGNYYVEDDDLDEQCEINPVKYRELVQDVINNGWRPKNWTLSSILIERYNLFVLDFAKDAYIDSAGDLFLPHYLEKWIAFPLFNTKFRLTQTELISSKADDPWAKRVGADVRRNVIQTSLNAIGTKRDSRDCLMGSALSRGQKYSNHSEELLKIILKDTLFFETYDLHLSVDLQQCYSGIITRYELYLYFIMRLRMILNYFQYEGCEGTDDKMIRRFHYLFQAKNMIQFMDGTLRLIFEKDERLMTIDESAEIHHQIAHGSVEQRMIAMEKSFPNFHRAWKRMKLAETVGETLIANFFMIYLFECGDVRAADIKNNYPGLVYSRDKIKLVPMHPSFEYGHRGAGALWHLLRFFPCAHDQTRQLDEDEVEISRNVYDYLTNEQIIFIEDSSSQRRLRRQHYEIHQSSFCGGVSEALSFIIPTIHPERGFVVFVITDEKITAHVRMELAISRFRKVEKYVFGIVLVQLDNEGNVQIFTKGKVSGKILQRTFLKYTHKVILCEMDQLVFGNDELITKLTGV